LLSNSGGFARERLDHGKPAFGRAAHQVNPPFPGILARHDVLTQRWKSLGFQLLQDRSKSRRQPLGWYHGQIRSENRLIWAAGILYISILSANTITKLTSISSGNPSLVRGLLEIHDYCNEEIL
jgi:hypothetical protein